MTKTKTSIPDQRWQKRSLLMVTDALSLACALGFILLSQAGRGSVPDSGWLWLLLLPPMVSLPFMILTGLYREVTRFAGRYLILRLFAAALSSALLLLLAARILGIRELEGMLLLEYALDAFVLLGASRFMAMALFDVLRARRQRRAVLIYGAGESGVMLKLALERDGEMRVVAFVDDNPALVNARLQGLPVYAPERIPELERSRGVEEILLAMPGLSSTERSYLVRSLEPYCIRVRTVPCMHDILSGRNRLEELREISIDELVGREVVAPDMNLMRICISEQRVMVTGAGGSIGSEICRQVLKLRPRCLVLFEISEFALYQIDAELRQLMEVQQVSLELVPCLGSVQDQGRVEEVLREYRIGTLYHAAAYKHVPMVEYNPVEGIRNNVFGTCSVALAARAVGVHYCVLVSTDKAVRPTNVMGATKRMAEQVLQSLASLPGPTVFSMVRFGNVLGSSGSVVPVFRRQIQEGGPITVTHPDIIRYFMTIPEAAQLVIQAGAMAKGGEVFLLDMGDPVRIVDLARRMIHLSGLSVRDEAHPEGDIGIRFTGLRPGEKLFEELLIDSSAFPTRHPRIFLAFEMFPAWERLAHELNRLANACAVRDKAVIDKILQTYVNGFESEIRPLSPYQPPVTRVDVVKPAPVTVGVLPEVPPATGASLPRPVARAESPLPQQVTLQPEAVLQDEGI
ncbi:MAG TPA: nucleoside-diphosphate sugar epimerase/dehydratase [Thiolinea sp.]|nr:nucleoside-diphosphate sugar epimerase/dehydratase [Thiolinea sp.]